MTPIPIHVYGDVIVDEYLTVHYDRFSAEDPTVPVARVSHVKSYLGGAANVAVNAWELSDRQNAVRLHHTRPATFDFVTAMYDAAWLRAQVEELHPGMGVLELPYTSPLSVKRRHFSTSGRQLYRTDLEKVSFCHPRPERHQRPRDFGQHRVSVVADYDKGAMIYDEAFSGLTDSAWIVVDPGRSGRWSVYEGHRTIFKVNESQLQQLYDYAEVACGIDAPRLGRRDTYGSQLCLQLDYFTALRAWLEWELKLEYLAIVVTCGAEGAALFTHTENVANLSHDVFVACGINEKPVIDVCGAGDAVLAALAVRFSTILPSLLHTCSIGWWQQTLMRAEDAGRKCVQYLGPNLPNDEPV